MSTNTTEPQVAVKARFQSLDKKYYGIFSVVINPKTSSITNIAVVVSLYSELYNINPHENNSQSLQTRINEIRYKGQYAQNYTFQLQDGLKNLAHDYTFFREIDIFFKKQTPINLEPSLKPFLAKVLDDKSLLVDVVVEQVDPTQEGKVQESPKQDITITTLDINLILAPVGGKLVSKLQIGDMLMIRIAGKDEKSNYFIDLLNLRTPEGQIKPIPSKIISIKNINNALEIITLIDESQKIHGKILEEENNVLVRIYDEKDMVSEPQISMLNTKKDVVNKQEQTNTTEKNSKSTSTKYTMNKEKKSSLMMIIGGASFLILLFFFIYLLGT